MGNSLSAIRKKVGWTQQEAADAIGVSKSQWIKLEREERELTISYIQKIANAAGVSQAEVIEGPRMVPLVGFVAAGAEAQLFGDGQGPFDYIEGPDDSNEATVAVEIRGQSLGPAFDRWLIFYDDRHSPVIPDLVGKLCVCGLADGRVMVKTLEKGGRPGRWTLVSNFEPPIYDVLIEWAAKVKLMRQA